ncbi:hypothetical protein NOGI109294_14055 [Nocardiopsis gilva]
MVKTGLFTGGVVGQAARVSDTELFGEVDDRVLGDLTGVGEEGAQRTRRAELHGEAEAVGLAPLGRDQLPVGVTEMEEAVQVRTRGRFGVAAIAGRLLVGEELNWHAPRSYEQARNA